ncbi:hypothetical protein [Gymnodinialimonas ulvae]|uniref:hypothetical protein n=1 Tax=Gymnodinialimonas ulvae TaxID=3126504 RepID=UPI0030B24582
MNKYTIRHEKTNDANHLLGDGKIAVGMTLGVITSALGWIALTYLADTNSIGEGLSIDPILVSLLVAFTSTYLAAKALTEQRKTREASTDPVLIAHLGQRADAAEMVTFLISNIGAGAALNVHVDVEKPDADTERYNLSTDIFRRYHPFSVIPQGKDIEFNLGVGFRLFEVGPLPPFKATLSYEDLAGDQYESDFTIDIRQMEKMTSHKSPQMRIVSALEDMAKN